MSSKVRILSQAFSKLSCVENAFFSRHIFPLGQSHTTISRGIQNVFMSSEGTQGVPVLSQKSTLKSTKFTPQDVLEITNPRSKYKFSSVNRNLEISLHRETLSCLSPVEMYKTPILDPILRKSVIHEKEFENIIGDQFDGISEIGDQMEKLIPLEEIISIKQSSLEMGSLLKKRRAKMNKHKYKKRMKRDRYKRMNIENMKAQKEKRKERAENRVKKLEEKKRKQREAAKARNMSTS